MHPRQPHSPRRTSASGAPPLGARPPLGLLVSGIASVWLAGACGLPGLAPEEPASNRPPPVRAALEALEPLPEGSLRVALAFSKRADLDLRVTDPNREVVHYARPRAASGLVFAGDRLCGDPAPRIELAVAAPACPGRYVIGVDFRERCQRRDAGDPEPDAVRWHLRVDRGSEIEWRSGSIEDGAFEAEIHAVTIEADEVESGAASDSDAAGAPAARVRPSCRR